MSKIALVTGATSGIGKATAQCFAAQGIDLIICGRREDRLKALQTELSGQVNVHYLVFDVRNRTVVEEQIAALPTEFDRIEILVNNAGNAHGLDLIQEGDPNDWDAMLDINVKGLLYVTKAVVNGMIDRGAGHIINVSSVAGKEVYPRGNVYSASKHAVDALTRGMLLDLNGTGVKVSSIDPGLVSTEFSEVRFKGDKERADAVYEGYSPLLAMDVAEVITFMVTRPAHVNISDLVILPTDQASATVVNKK